MKFTTIAAAALVASTATATLAEELKFASFTPGPHTVTASVIEKLNDVLSEATGGELTVRGYLGGELGAGPVEQYVRVVQGVADIAWGLPGYTSSQFQKTMISELPGVLTAGEHGFDNIWAAYDEHLADEFPGTIPVAIWISEPNVMIMNGHEIREPGDLEGLKIRVAGATAGEVATALGATPVQMPINQVYNALQTGLIDGVFTGSSTLSDFKLDEVADSYTFGAPLGNLTFYAVMNADKFNSLPADQQQAILDARAIVSESAEVAWFATADAAVAAARASGENTFIDLSGDEVQAFADVVLPVTNSYVEAVGGADALAALADE